MEWTDEDWGLLLRLISFKRCTPFLGAGAAVPKLPTGSELAQRLVAKYQAYPVREDRDLTRVAQWALCHANEVDLRESVRNWLQKAGTLDSEDPDELHWVLAGLDLPIYMTTNYDDFMTTALKRRGRRPCREVCKWHLARRRRSIPKFPSCRGFQRDYVPSEKSPLVFHLHGTLDEPESMVLTEDDYLDFLIYIQGLIPPRVEEAFSESCLLFLGYSLKDMSFKVLFRKLASYASRSLGTRHFAVQLDPTDEREPSQRIEDQRWYQEDRYQAQMIKVYWGSCRDFAAELRQRWEAFPHA